MIIPAVRLDRIAQRQRENLCFYPADSLSAAASDVKHSDATRRACVAELLIRRYLEPESVADEVLNGLLGDDWRAMENLLSERCLVNPSADDVPEKLWEAHGDFSATCEVAVRARLRELLGQTDGFIPVFLTGERDSESSGFFLPFRFVDRCAEKPCIRDASGEAIPGWAGAYESLFGGDMAYDCVVSCHQGALGKVKLMGHSLMLPLWLGYHRKTGELPRYHHLHLLATGAFDADGRLCAVEVEEKLRSLTHQFSQGILFCPESDQNSLQHPQMVKLSAGLTKAQVLEEMKQEIEAKGLVVPSFRQACQSLGMLSDDIQYGNYNRWDRMLERLRTNEQAMDANRDPRRYLLCLMLKSAVNCHKGDTAVALQLNHAARDFASVHGCLRELRRLEVEELVELQDQEKFSQIKALSGGLAESMAGSSDDDLLMRYHGTMGQAHCYGFLSGIGDFSPETAKEHFSKALDHAYKLNSEADIAQDLNYCYLWQALFHYGAPEAKQAYAAASDHIRRNLQNDSACRTRNLFFLRRLRLMEWYRQLLATGQAAGVDIKQEMMPDSADSWLRALGGKYCGALAAAQGKADMACMFFGRGEALLGGKAAADSIIGYIRMTVLAEAYRSLGDGEYRRKALEAVGMLKAKYPESVGPWEAFLEASGQFPGLNYWY